MINDEIGAELSSSFRVLHGKLYAALLGQFGIIYVDEIEDVIQNTFLKALKTWKPGKIPGNKESWLFIVARNDMLNYIKSLEARRKLAAENEAEAQESELHDLRLETILFLCEQEDLSDKATILLVLKNVFGLHVKEISNATLMSEEAIHKLVNRTNKKLQGTDRKPFESEARKVNENQVSIVIEILYGVFSIGFDSFDKKANKIVNDDLCLEALALAQLLHKRLASDVTSNLISLFCFHLARIPSKVYEGQLVPFIKQNRENWDRDFLNVAFQYLKKPEELNPFYLEALITSRHMSAEELGSEHWKEIVKLYKLWQMISDSPLVKLNLTYSLYLAGEVDESKELIQSLEKMLPQNHVYFSLIKAEMIKHERQEDYQQIVQKVIDGLDHEMRKDFLTQKLKDNQNENE